MVLKAPTLIPGIARTPLPYGLFSILAFREGGNDRWRMGAEWETGTCAPALGMADIICLAEGATPAGYPRSYTEGDGATGEATPFTVFGHYACSPVATSFEEAQTKANAHLLAREEARVEQALWTGDLGNVPNFAGANGYPAATAIGTYNVNTADADEHDAALAAAESWLGKNYGSQGVIHVGRGVASRLKLEKRGGRLFTKLDTPVVAGAGYGEDAIIVTPAMFGHRSAVETSSAIPGDLFNPLQNDLVASAERQYLLAFDPCGFGRVTLTTAP